jgi:hypothetical protein
MHLDSLLRLLLFLFYLLYFLLGLSLPETVLHSLPTEWWLRSRLSSEYIRLLFFSLSPFLSVHCSLLLALSLCRIQFLGTQKALSKLSSDAKRRIQKLRCGLLPVNKSCSPSNLVEERVDHIFSCPHQIRRDAMHFEGMTKTFLNFGWHRYTFALIKMDTATSTYSRDLHNSTFLPTNSLPKHSRKSAQRDRTYRTLPITRMPRLPA